MRALADAGRVERFLEALPAIDPATFRRSVEEFAARA